MAVVSMKELLEAGVHFGHQTRRWNPKMKRFIFDERGGIYIIDLQQTQALLQEAHDFARNIAERGGTILFVGTKKQAQDAIVREATRVGQPYVAHRWLGGLLTNWRTIADRISYLQELRRLKEEGQLDLLPAKERIAMGGELEKLEANLGGVSTMKRQPDAVFIVDLRKEQLAVREAQRLGLPVIALVDTNCDPDEATYVVPGNDDAIRSCSLVVRAIADGVATATTKVTEAELTAPREEAAAETVDEGTVAEDRNRRGRRRGARGRRGAGRRGERSARVSEISAALVKELRDQTGAGMMDCKRALQETGGDIDAARTLLREKGMAAAGKRADRATTEGIVLVEESGDTAAIVGVGCETEPVSKNEAFREFAEKALERVSANGNGAGAAEALEAERVELVAQLGENIVVVDGTRFEGGTLASYVHPPARKIGVLVQLEGGSADLARQVAMHISFAAPEYTARDDVPEDVLAAERQIYLNSDEVQSKPEQAREKIVEGMLAKRFLAAAPGGALLEQAWIHDVSKTVRAALEEQGASVKAFSRISVAGS